MAFFRKKKKSEEEKIGPLPEFPKQEFPEFQRLPEEKPREERFPTYEPEIRPPVQPQVRAFKPVIEPREEVMMSAREHPTFPKFAPEKPPIVEEPRIIEERPRVIEEKPVFVKIEKYKEAIRTIDQIKEKVEDAEEILRGLNETNVREGRELDSWRNDINKIKNHWFDDPLRYKFGASIRIDNPNEYIVKIEH